MSLCPLPFPTCFPRTHMPPSSPANCASPSTGCNDLPHAPLPACSIGARPSRELSWPELIYCWKPQAVDGGPMSHTKQSLFFSCGCEAWNVQGLPDPALQPCGLVPLTSLLGTLLGIYRAHIHSRWHGEARSDGTPSGANLS